MTLGQRELDDLRRLEPSDVYLDLAAAHGDEVVPAGPFRAMFNPHSDAIWANQALPMEPLGADEEVILHLHALCRLFDERRRTPVVEFNEPLWPRLPALLEGAGFAEFEREPLMLCAPEDFRPLWNPAVHVRFLSVADSEADFVAYQSIFSQVLTDGSWRPTREAIARFRSEVEGARGRSHALAMLESEAVGTGYIWSFEGVSEITRMATLPGARRRGVAATLTSFMLRDRFGGSDTLAWLTASDAAAQALYEKLGFRPVGTRRYYRFAGGG